MNEIVKAEVYDDELGIDRLQRTPIIDRMDERQLTLIKNTLAVSESEQFPITHAELGHFLELSALYGLDPFAREIWIAKSKTGKLLIMVGRDGLRKIAHRGNLKVGGSVIREKDTFSVLLIQTPGDMVTNGLVPEGVTWTALVDTFERMGGGSPFHHVTHKVAGLGDAAGDVAGAWCRVTDKAGVERGFFYAPISEYRPADVSRYSPWAKQVSAMMLGAVERQAIRQATPLGGIMAEGEDLSIVDSTATEISTGEGDGSAPGWSGVDEDLVPALDDVIARAEALDFPGFGDKATIQMRHIGQKREAIEEWLAAAEEQLTLLENGS